MNQKMNYHDGEVVGLQISGKDILLSILSENKTYVLTLQNVLLFRADTFLKGNIILDTHVQSVAAISRDKLIENLSSLYEEGYVNEASIQQCYKGNKVYFELNPSYGCEIVAVCDAVIEQEVLTNLN